MNQQCISLFGQHLISCTDFIFSIQRVRTTAPLATDIAQKDKNNAKRTKLSTRMESARKTEAEGVYILNGPTLFLLVDGTWHSNQGFTMIAWRIIKIEGPGLVDEERLKSLEPSPLHYK
ncbi:hypothetical protein Tco_1135909 [Tanacetum coccineum]